MEKRTPHYPLSLVKRLLERGQFIVTLEARITGARDFSINDMDDFRRYLLKLAHRDFYKSMTTLKDHRVWQDVYHLEVGNAQAYVKVQVLNDNAVLISFKTL